MKFTNGWTAFCPTVVFISVDVSLYLEFSYKSISQLSVWLGGSLEGSGVVGGMDLVRAELSLGLVFCCGLWKFVVDGGVILGFGLCVGRAYRDFG